MYKIVASILLVMFFSSSSYAVDNQLVSEVKQKAGSLAHKIKAAGRSRVAALDFTSLDGTTVTELGKLIAELLNVSLTDGTGLVIIDRFHLEKVLKEQKLNRSGLFDPRHSSKIGELSGVEVVIIGSISVVGSNSLISFKAIDTETASNIGSELLEIKNTVEIQSLGRRIISSKADDVYTTSDRTYVNSAHFFTDLDTVRCQGLGTFKSYHHALAQACYYTPKGEDKKFSCHWLNQSDNKWELIVGKTKFFTICNNMNKDQATVNLYNRLIQENGN